MIKFAGKLFFFLMLLLCFFLLKREGFCETSNSTIENSKNDAAVKKIDKRKVSAVRGEEDKMKEKKEKEKKKVAKDESWKEAVFPLTDEDLEYIRKKAERQRYITEVEYERLGRVKYVHADDRSVFKINAMIDRVTVVCFWKEIDDAGYLVGSADFKSGLIENKKCVAVYPLKPFKESNLVVFVDNFPYSFTLREVYERSEVDYVVIVNKKPYLKAKEFLLYLLAGNFPEEISRWVKIVKEKQGIREFIFEGFNTLKAIECEKWVEPLEKTWIVKGCVKDKCYFIFEGAKN